MKLSLCMIVRDNEKTIRPCIESILPWVDEVVVVDTGSKDQTPAIVQSFGAKLSFFEWADDFSAARNESIDRANGEWIFWMDSDDTINAECGRKLRILADSVHADSTMGYVMQVRCPSSRDNGIAEFTVVDHVKMFRNRPDLRFEGRIHEQVLMPIRAIGGEVSWTDIWVEHSGSEQSKLSQQKKLIEICGSCIRTLKIGRGIPLCYLILQ
jgi:glycosyltransferase involved in cell wall biosynthesis